MPKEIPEDLRETIERYGGLEEINKLYKKPVGRPSDLRRTCLDVIFNLLKDYSANQPGRTLTQGRLIELATKELKKQGIKVGTAVDYDKHMDEKTLRDAVKLVRLTCGDKNVNNYTISEWKWLIKHSSKEGRSAAKKKVSQMLEILQRRQKDDASLAHLSAKYPNTPIPTSIQNLSELMSRTVKYYQRVAALFPSR